MYIGRVLSKHKLLVAPSVRGCQSAQDDALRYQQVISITFYRSACLFRRRADQRYGAHDVIAVEVAHTQGRIGSQIWCLTDSLDLLCARIEQQKLCRRIFMYCGGVYDLHYHRCWGFHGWRRYESSGKAVALLTPESFRECLLNVKQHVRMPLSVLWTTIAVTYVGKQITRVSILNYIR